MLATLLALALSSSPIAGQLAGDGVTVEYTQRAKGAAPNVLEQVSAARDGFVRTLSRRWPRPIVIRLGVGRAELEGLALEGSAPPSWASALAYPERDAMLLDALSLSEPTGPSTIRHEVVHLALGQLGPFPRWFHEGLATVLADEGSDAASYSAMYRGVRTGRIASFDDLADGWPTHRLDVELAYAQSASFAEFLIARHPPEAFDELFELVRSGDPFERAFGKSFHASIGSEEAAWKRTLERRYGSIPLAALLSLMWSLAAVLCVVAFLRRRAAKERNLRRMDEETAALAEPATPPPEPPSAEPPPPTVH